MNDQEENKIKVTTLLPQELQRLVYKRLQEGEAIEDIKYDLKKSGVRISDIQFPDSEVDDKKNIYLFNKIARVMIIGGFLLTIFSGISFVVMLGLREFSPGALISFLLGILLVALGFIQSKSLKK